MTGRPKTRLELIEEQGAAADEAMQLLADYEAQLARFPRGSVARREIEKHVEERVAQEKGARSADTTRALIEAVKRRANVLDLPERGEAAGRKRFGAVAVGDDPVALLAHVVGPTKRRGAPLKAQLLLDLVEVFRQMRAHGIEPPRRYLNREHAAFVPLWRVLCRHRRLKAIPLGELLRMAGATAEGSGAINWDLMAELIDWSAFDPAPELLRRVEADMARYFRRAHELA